MAKKAKKETRPVEPQQPQQKDAITASAAAATPTAASTPPSHTTQASMWSIFRSSDAQKAIQLISLAAISSHISQLSLSPVYGAIPAGMYHKYGSYAAAILAIGFRSQVRQFIPATASDFLPALAFWIPNIQFVLFKYSSTFGNPYGPVITELLTYYPLVILSLFVSGSYVDKINLSGFGELVTEIGPSTVSLVLFVLMQRLLKAFFWRNVGSNLLMSRVGMQLVAASMYALLVPSALFPASLTSVAFTMLANVHLPLERTTEVANSTLALYDYVLLDRQESVSGYISVIENTAEHFRVMRCDHSLLGGEWTMEPPTGQVSKVKEPIYGVFAMLEAVRLVKSDEATTKPDSKKFALNIGLGIGTAPTALIAHGVNTTIIELDPVVHKFAVEYFALPNHTYVIADAALVVDAWSHGSNKQRYDYIISDGFSGGTIPSELFTLEYFSGISTLLQDDGVVAINYAGDLSNDATSLVYRTVKAAFPYCRVFREDEAPISEPSGGDLTNMVFFCKKKAPVKFRKPIEADFLGSGARKQFLDLKYEVSPDTFKTKGDILKRGRTRQLDRLQAQSAIEHWRLMRTVLPDVVWENW